MSNTLGQNIHVCGNIASTAGTTLGAPVADAFNGTGTSDIVSLENWGTATFLVIRGVNAGSDGTATLTVEACSTSAAADTHAATFHYKLITTPDTCGAWTAATSSGFLWAHAAYATAVVEVTAEEVAAAGGHGYQWVRLKSVETGTDNYVGAVICLLSEPRYADPTTAVATS